jgi:hypothetical protein
MSSRVVTTPSVMSTRVINTPSLMSTRTINRPSVTTSVTSNRTFTNPFLTNPFLTNPFLTNPSLTPRLNADAILRRQMLFTNPFLLQNFGRNPSLQFNGFLGRLGGLDPFMGAGFTGLAGSTALIPVGVGSASVTPVGGAGGNTTAVAQKSSGDTEEAARAALLLEQVIAERLVNRRQAFDQLLYERDKTPTPEQELLSRSRMTPPLAEVLSGQALNALLDDLRTPAGTDPADRPNPRLPLDARGLRHINVTRGAGNIALLKNGSPLTWPTVLAGPAFQVPRDRLGALAPEAVRQAGTAGRVDPGTLRQMAADVDQLRTLLRLNARELSFQPLYEARGFLQRLDDALVALGQPDAADYFNGTYDLTAQTVLGLVRQMADRGLRFAPALPGDESAYAALREALAACDRTAAKPPAPAPAR